MARDIVRVRNIGIMAHVDAGKTTCTERILYFTGLIHRMGEVHHGTATTDFDPEEQRRGITISAATVTTSWEPAAGELAGVRHTLRIIDTPGHVDFAIEVERSLRVLDGAIVVLDASSGVECQSEAVWRQAERYQVPRLTFVNKMDKVGASFALCLNDLRERLAAKPVAIQWPSGEGSEFRGVIDLLVWRELRFVGNSGEIVEICPVPDELAATARAARALLIEACAEVDDTVFEAWANGREPALSALERALRVAALSGRFHLVLCGSALANQGIQPLLDAVVQYLPSPLDRPAAIGVDAHSGEAVPCAPDADEPTLALAFKTQSDARGSLTFLRVYSGRLRRGDTVLLPARGLRERIGRLYVVHADEREEVDEASAGDIVAALGLRHARTGDTLAAPERPAVLEALVVPEPVLEVAIEPKTAQDRDRLGQALSRLTLDDPSLGLRIDEETGQTVLRAMGELHVEIAQTHLRRDHGVEIRIGAPQVAYRDTVRRLSRIAYKHEKQDGGVGQFARVVLELEPGARGSGIAFTDETVGGTVPRVFLPGVEKGVRNAAERGVRGGYPLVDLVVRLIDGQHHVRDSSPLAFELAASAAFQEAVRSSLPVLLEPLMALEVTVPEESVGCVVGDLSARRGAIQKLEPRNRLTVVTVHAPLGTLFGYVPALRSLTHGRGTAVMKPLGYEIVPERLVPRILAA